MTNPPVSYEELSAFVDGELDPKRMAAISQAIAHDPALAKQAAALAALKEGVADLYPAAPGTLPDVPLSAHRPGRRATKRVAAGIAVVVLIAMGLVVGLISKSPRQGPDISIALALHRAGDTSSGRHAAKEHLDILVPDLTASRLNVARVTAVRTPSGRVARIEYRGTRGCRISLFLFPSMLGPDALAIAAAMPTAVAWNEKGRGYLVAASDVGARRLETIVAAIRYQFRERRPLTQALKRGLAEARVRSVPCPA